MSRTKTIGVVIAAFLSGVVFVMACDDDPLTPDASTDAHAAECTACEPPITASRVYEVVDRSVASTPDNIVETARCQMGDLLLGGGCAIHRDLANGFDTSVINLHPLILTGPLPSVGTQTATAGYNCWYENEENAIDLVVVATAICLDITP